MRAAGIYRCSLEWTGELANLGKPQGCLGLVCFDESIA
jgi:hypothetical protein